MKPGARVSPILAMLSIALATAASAGLNAGTVVTASWSPTMQVSQADCAPVNTAYLTYSRAEGLTFAGAEVHLEWASGFPAPVRHDPAGASGCVTYLQSLFPHSTTSCTALNRGGTTVQTEDAFSTDGYGYVELIWLNSQTNTSCDSGQVVEVQIESDPCVDCGYAVYVGYASVYDGAAFDYCYINAWLTLGHGPSFAVAPTTWGAIKNLMRR